MPDYFLFFFYLFTGTLLLHLIIRRKIFPFTIYHTASIVFFKVFMGCLYGWLFLHFYGGDDTWNYFIESRDATAELLSHPVGFFREFGPVHSLEMTGYHPLDALFYYINHFERWFMIKGQGILNLFTGKNYYVNLIWFEFLTIPGPLLLFKLLARHFPQRAGMNFLLVFFIPSVVFWCSGIRAEGILLLGTVLMLYNGEGYARKSGGLKIAGWLTGFILILLFRYQFLLVFLPVIFAFMYSMRKQVASPVYFNRVILVSAGIFLASLFLPPAYQLSRPMLQAQESFFKLKGNTRYTLDSLKPGPVSFLTVFPQAVVNTLFRPLPWEGKNLMQSVSSVDVLLLLAGILFFTLGPLRKQQIAHPLYWLFIYYGILQLIVIGYITPFPGAIVRYRAIPFLFLFLFFYAGNPILQQKLRYRIFKLH